MKHGLPALVAILLTGVAPSLVEGQGSPPAGRVLAWGSNSYGQTSWADLSPGVVAIASGHDHTVVLKADGTVAAWGLSLSGQTTVPANLVDVTAIAAGYQHSAALKADGTVVVWGIGGGGGAPINVPGGLSGVTQIAAGQYHMVVRKSDGTVVAWGSNDFGQRTVPSGLSGVVSVAAGYHYSLALKDDGTVVGWGQNSQNQATPPVGLDHVVALAAGDNHSLALKDDGTVVAWGFNGQGQATVPAGLGTVVAISASSANSFALKEDGTVVAWGANNYGETVVPPGLVDVSAIAAGNNHSVALKSDGTLALWGRDNWGQKTIPDPGLVRAISSGSNRTVVVKEDGTVMARGNNDFGQTDVPGSLGGVVSVVAGADHSLALKSDGTVVAWGSNFQGETMVPGGLSNVVAVAAGWRHCLALKDDGTVVAWGRNNEGQTSVPSGLDEVVAISSGDSHNLALKSDGTVVAWGLNSNGQTTVPPDLANVATISAGGYFSLALKSDGTVRAWGANGQNQSNVPAGLANVVAIDAGVAHSLALKADGTVVAWGQNTRGQTTLPPGLANVVAVSAGSEHSAVIVDIGLQLRTLEVTSRDLGLSDTGFEGGGTLASLTVDPHTRLQLVDLVDDAAGAEPECAYVESLVVPDGTELDLNGLNLYARRTRIEGAVTNGTVRQLAEAHPLTLNDPEEGAISLAGELDAWTFFGRGGDRVKVVVETGPPTVGPPAIARALVLLRDASGNLLSSRSGEIANAAVVLNEVSLPADGHYTVQVRAPIGHTASTGNYRVAAWEVTPEIRSLVLNQTHQGLIENPHSVDHWTFTGVAGQSVDFDVLNTSGPGVAFHLSGPVSWVGFAGVTTGSAPVTLAFTGTYTLSAYGTGETGNVAYSMRMADTQQFDLTLGVPHTGALTGDGQALLFRLDLDQSGPLELDLVNGGLGNRTELYASRGEPPSRNGHEYAVRSGPGANRRLLIPSATAGVWYFLVYADRVPAPGDYTLEATQSAVVLSGLSLTRQPSNAATNLTVTGAGFAPGTVVDFVASGGAAFGGAVSLDSYTQLTVAFAANAVPPGLYSLRVTLPGGGTTTLPDAFTFLPPGSAILETKVILPGVLGRHAVDTIYVEYANTGDTPMAAPLLVLKSADPDGSDRPIFTLDAARVIPGFWAGVEEAPEDTSTEVYLLASGAQAGVLAPGERRQVPVHYLGLVMPWDFADNEIEVEVRHWLADDPTPIDWAARKASLRPPTLDAAVWDIVYANLTEGLATTADFVGMLNDNARYLARLGLRITNVAELWGFEIHQAYGHSLLPVLDEAVDSHVAAQGTPLDLKRSFSSNLRSRQSIGPFGRGWYTVWQSRIFVERGGALVKLVGEAGAGRSYSSDTRYPGTFFSDPGDSGTLRPAGDGYELKAPDGSKTRYRSDGRIAWMEDANGNRVTAAWNGAGQLLSLTHSSGGSITLTYNGAGFVATASNSAGRSVTYGYTGNYLTSVTTDDGKVTSYTYDSAGPPSRRHALTSVTRGGTSRLFTWDERGRLKTTSLASGDGLATFSYDSAGAVSVAASGGTTTLYFEHRGLISKSIDPFGHATVSEYDHDLRLRRLVLPTGESRGFTWCKCGSPSSLTDELGNVTRFNYDHPLKEMTRFQDAKGNRTNYEYDAKGNRVRTVYADGSDELLQNHTASGLPQTRINRRDETTTYTYTAAGHIDRRTFADGSYDDFDYDARGNLVRVLEHPASGPDKTTTFQFAPAIDGDRLRRVDHPNGEWVEYTYDGEGRRASMTDSTGGEVHYAYDGDGRLWKVLNANDDLVVEYLYGGTGRLDRTNKGNGSFTEYDYDAAGRIVEVANRTQGGALTSRFAYNYDSLGRRTSMKTLRGDWTYRYDPTGRLVLATFDSSVIGGDDQSLRYHYDAAGNRTLVERNGVSTAYVTNSLNQYTGVGGTTRQFDDDGNLTYDGERTLEYDTQNRLVRSTGPEGVTEYEYNALGHRTATILDGSRTEHLLDPSGLIHVIAEKKASNDLRRSIHGIGLVSQVTESGESVFFDFDAIGSTAAITSEPGSVLNSYSYDPFGEILESEEGLGNNRKFAGIHGVMSEPSGLHHMRERFFEVATATFTSPDPIGLRGGLNFYEYAKNDPVSYVDPAGLSGGSGNPAIDFGPPGGGGCGSDGNSQYIPDRIASADFTAACDAHDECYSTCGAGKSSCDSAFFADMFAAGSSLGLEGALGIASLYSGAVTFFGASAYDAAQKEACKPKEEETPVGGGPGSPGGGGGSGVAGAIDPNEKFGPGFGPEGWVRADALLPYRINFENIGPGSRDANGDPYPTVATAPAQRVTITDELESSLDWSTFQVTEFGWGDTVVPVAPGTSHYTGTIFVTVNGQSFHVEVEAGIDFASGEVFARFQSLDPETSLPPPVLVGFLPPEDGNGVGKGHFSYTIRSKDGLVTGTEIRNIASIRFDGNEVITTNQIDPQDASEGTDPAKEALVTLDGDAPSSTIGILPAKSTGTTFTVSWSGADLGAGIAAFDIYVSVDGGPWQLWLSRTSETSSVYTGQRGRRYGFLSVARDRIGNLQTASTLPQATITVAADQRPIVRISGKKLARVRSTSTRVLLRGSASDANGDLLRVEVRDSRPKGRKTFRRARGTSNWSFNAPLRPGRNSIEARAVDQVGNRSATTRITILRR